MNDAYRMKEVNEGITEINELAGMWEIRIKDWPIHLKIKVFRTAEDTSDPYIASPNYSIQKSKKDSDCTIISNHHTIQEALEDSLRDFLFYYNKKEIDHTDFVLNKDW